MKEEQITELLKRLFALTYNWKSDSSSYTSEVIKKEGRHNVENIVRSFLLDNRDEKLGVLEAKVFMYEQIISKSNFAPMIEIKIPEPVQSQA
ncbi:MAG: hypothetical protein V4497_09435 [Bacteroidota bacterium]